MPHQVTPSGSIHNEWNERVQTGDPSPTPENARSVTGAICRLNRFLLTRLHISIRDLWGNIFSRKKIQNLAKSYD